jgi:hypothetical protein
VWLGWAGGLSDERIGVGSRDANGNAYVGTVLGSVVYEILKAGGFSTVVTLGHAVNDIGEIGFGIETVEL